MPIELSNVYKYGCVGNIRYSICVKWLSRVIIVNLSHKDMFVT